MVTVLLLIVLINIIAKDNSSNVYAASSSSTSDLQLMARAINGEARGEPYEGQVAVGAVILNRVRSSSFPNTIAGVIYEPGAFTASSRWPDKCSYCRKFYCIISCTRCIKWLGPNRVEQYIILIQIQQQINGYGQDHL